MTELYDDKDYKKAFGLRKKYLVIYFSIAAVYLAATLTVVFLQNRSIQVMMATINIITTAIFFCFTLFFFSIKFRITHSYCKMLKGFNAGIKENATGEFLRYESGVQEKDGVECNIFVLEVPSVKHNEVVMERKVLVDKMIEMPKFCERDKVKIVTHANFLTGYQILKN